MVTSADTVTSPISRPIIATSVVLANETVTVTRSPCRHGSSTDKRPQCGRGVGGLRGGAAR